ncbi:hypothetical protein SAMN06265339_1378 [Desulfurobacterium pacificum]|jgi:hypothetical protein|uniref:Uncharacterized protein n=1 Tax=Desulfurobacterium pacificum TaxID=240166 RepID=A0ABY1NQ23_9BACT|nr:hypothetical protein [Desulfurobacterium pacificum]SMP15283.1 hypothetical protein SAMN06265339_1378 [Desulfurobacterium pacificum]
MDLKKEELKYSWDGNRTKSVLVARRMMYDNPRDVYREYGEEYLKEVFLRHYNLFNDVNRVFWKTILGISDEEIEEKTKGSFRNACKIWNY